MNQGSTVTVKHCKLKSAAIRAFGLSSGMVKLTNRHAVYPNEKQIKPKQKKGSNSLNLKVSLRGGSGAKRSKEKEKGIHV